jgi:hypothetical protein
MATDHFQSNQGPGKERDQGDFPEPDMPLSGKADLWLEVQ